MMKYPSGPLSSKFTSVLSQQIIFFSFFHCGPMFAFCAWVYKLKTGLSQPQGGELIFSGLTQNYVMDLASH